MRRRIIIYTLLFAVFYLLQTALNPITVFGVSPEYILACTVVLAMTEKEKFGSIYGLVFGLLCDFSSSGLFGTRALLFMAVGYVVGFLATSFMSVSLIGALFLGSMSAVIIETLLCTAYSFFMSLPLVPLLLYTALPKLLLTLPVIIIVYIVFRLTGKRISKREERIGTW